MHYLLLFAAEPRMSRWLLRRLVVAASVVAVAGTAAAAGQATAPVQIKHIDISDSFTLFAGRHCAFDVTGTVSGTGSVTLWMNDSGEVVGEHDTTPGSTITFSGNGKSFSFPIAVSVETDYGSGAVVGGAATSKLTGMFGHVPGYSPSDAGELIIAHQTVIGFDSVDGAEIPVVGGGDLQVQHGSFHSPEEIDAALCAALS
jgi:hypothetical protein